MKSGRNDPCPCGSGKKYKNCHWEILSKHGLHRLSAYQTKYIKEWDVTSTAYEAQSAYDWMADQLAVQCTPLRVLDIGCGSGQGIDSLLKRFGKELFVLGLEQNEQCIKRAVSPEGCEWNSVFRADPELVSENGYLTRFTPGLLPRTLEGVTIIESDVLFDPEIETYLQGLPKFDAVTIWLIGAQQGMQDCQSLNSLNVITPGDLRLRIQNKVYALADTLLRPCGVLQVVDRAEYPTSELLIEDGLRSHREQASMTSLAVSTSTYMEYKEPTNGGVGMTVTHGTSGRIANTDRRAFRSVISIKPPDVRLGEAVT